MKPLGFSTKKIHVFTDGSVQGACACYGCIIKEIGPGGIILKELPLKFKKTGGNINPNQAELLAILAALKELSKSPYIPTTIHSDSSYAVNTIRKYHPNRKKRIKNTDLIRQIWELLQGYPAELKWIPRGENVEADRLVKSCESLGE